MDRTRRRCGVLDGSGQGKELPPETQDCFHGTLTGENPISKEDLEGYTPTKLHLNTSRILNTEISV